jgi:predicted tellurium resistance membrane protein TerC
LEVFGWNFFSEFVLAAGPVTVDPSNGWIGLAAALIALSVMEIVLGIDNIVFISIATSKLPKEQQQRARLIGLGLAMGFRVLLLCFIATIVSWTQPLFQLNQLLPGFLHSLIEGQEEINAVSVRDLILFGGGLFLIYQSVREIHHLTESHDDLASISSVRPAKFGAVLVQIALLDIVFSLDSVITAVGMVDSIAVMIAAVMISVFVMMIFSGPISSFVMKHPSVKVLALSFLLMIGVMLVAEGFGTHFNKNYVYFAMAFSLVVELLNLRISKKRNASLATKI